MQRVLFASLTSALLLGCADVPSAPRDQLARDQSSISTARSAARSAASGGAVVVRGLLALGFIILDEREGLTTVIGLTEAELADFCLTGNTQPHLVDFLDVIRPKGAVKELWKGEDDPVLVWPFLSGDLCGLLATTSPQWAGTTDWQGTDNEVLGLGEGPGANSLGLQAHGEVTDAATGATLRYQADFRFVVSPDGEEVLGNPVAKIRLR